MSKDDFDSTVDKWTTWATQQTQPCYDIALFKIWIQFEIFLRDLFVWYATGHTSETGFLPGLKLSFQSEEHMNMFLKENKKYIDYLPKIESLSKHIFIDDPFTNVIFNISDNKDVYDEIQCIRNYIAHESHESRKKIINKIFNGVDTKFVEPSDYLLKIKKGTKQTNYTYYVSTLKNIVELLLSPPQ